MGDCQMAVEKGNNGLRGSLMDVKHGQLHDVIVAPHFEACLRFTRCTYTAAYMLALYHDSADNWFSYGTHSFCCSFVADGTQSLITDG